MALCHLIPGATMMQMSTYVGYRLRGLPGATGRCGRVHPAGVSADDGSVGSLFRLRRSSLVRAVFVGLGAIVVAIILNACVSLGRTVVHGWQGLLLVALAFAALALRVNLLLVLLGAALLALVLFRGEPAPAAAAKEPADDAPRVGRGGRRGGVRPPGPVDLRARPGQLNLVLMKVDLMAFGGGFTTIPLIQREVVDRFGWVTTREFIDGIALGQVTPGPIVITATFVAYKVGGLMGALLGTIAVFFPSFVIVTTLAPYYDRIKRSRPIQVMVRASWRRSSECCSWSLTVSAREALVDWKTWAVMAAAWLALWRKVDLLLVVGVGAALSVVLF